MIKDGPTVRLKPSSRGYFDNVSPQKKWEMLLSAAKNGNLPLVKDLLDNHETEIDVYLYEQNYEGISEDLDDDEEIPSMAKTKVLMIATKRFHLEMIEWIFSEMALEPQEGKFGQFAPLASKLIKACALGNVAVVAFYLRQNKLIVSSGLLMEALRIAAEKGHLQVVQCIFSLAFNKINYPKVETILWATCSQSTSLTAYKIRALQEEVFELARICENAANQRISIVCFLYTQIHQRIDPQPLFVWAANKHMFALVQLIFELSRDKLDINTFDEAIKYCKATDDQHTKLFLFRKREELRQTQKSTFSPPIPLPTNSGSVAEDIFFNSLTLLHQFRTSEAGLQRHQGATRVLEALCDIDSSESASSSDSDFKECDDMSTSSSDSDSDPYLFSDSSSDLDEEPSIANNEIVDDNISERFRNLSLRPGRN